MKSFKNLLTLFAALTAMAFITSCGDDDPIIVDPGTDGINVADGFYVAAVGADPVSAAALTAEVVEADGYASQERAGFQAGYVYLTNGSYRIVEIADKEETSTLGGSAADVEDMGSACDQNNYSVVSGAEVGDGSFSVAVSGLYKVSYDVNTKEVMMYEIKNAGLIGSAVQPDQWNNDFKMEGTITADGATWTASDIEMRAGEYKIRMNCRWSIDRRAEPMGFDFDNGYVMFTNFGGSASDLVPGGGNISFSATDEGIYTATLNWSPVDGLSFTAEKTGDVAPITFAPDENKWALTGNATPNGWPNDDPMDDPIGVDHDFTYDGLNAGTHTWSIATISLVEGAMKFRANDDWGKNMGSGQVTLTGDVAEFTGDGAGGDIALSAAGAGAYEVVLTTSDDGDSYTANFKKL